MVPQLENYIQNEEAKTNDNAPLTRKEVVRSLINTTTNDHLRFQGVNLRGADLYKLDLRYINFKVLFTNNLLDFFVIFVYKKCP